MSDKIQNQNLSAKYAVLQADYWMLYCAVFGYVSVFLLAKKFSAGNIGILMAWGNVVSAVLQPWIASVADRSKRFTLKDVMLLLAVLGAVPAVFLVVLPDIMPVIAGLFLVIMIVISILQPLVNSVNGYYVSQGCPMNFGLARGIGSFSFAAISYVLGHLVTLWGEDVVPIAVAVLLILFVVILSTFRMRRGDDPEMELAEETDGSGECIFRKYRVFFLLLIGIVLVFAFHNMTNTYLIQIMAQFGGNSSDMGTSIAIAAMCEIPAMVLFSKIIRKVRANQLLRIAALGYLVKAVAMWMAGSVMMIHMTQLLQAFSFAILIPASVYYSDEMMDPQDRIRGQALVTAFITVGGVIGNLLGGRLIDLAGVPAMLSAGVVCAGAGMVLMWIAAVPPKRKKKNDTGRG